MCHLLLESDLYVQEVEHVPIVAMNNESFENSANSIKLFGCISKDKRDFETNSFFIITLNIYITT